MSDDEPSSADETVAESDGGISRRRLVAAGAATWASVSLAGCDRLDDPGVPTTESTTTTTEDDGGGNGNGNGNGTGGTTVTNETTTTDAPGSGQTTTSSGGGCAAVRRFAAGMEVGLHVDVYDSASGEHLGAEEIESVTVEFPNAEFGPLELNWEGKHERYSETSWGSKIETSRETEPGTYQYEINIEGDQSLEETIVDQFTIV